ncbi:carboxylesterase family protein [Urechidicola croceus]|nr:prolyl oligopeptidase family serine peptidase [Urechidicola croceus]
MKNIFLTFLLTLVTMISSYAQKENLSSEELLRVAYISQYDNTAREYFVYLPKGYSNNPNKKWPILMFLHGNGERGNGTDELDYVMIHGPLYEAWVQKRDLPFIMIVPQLHMFDMEKLGIDYINGRSTDWIPKRLKNGVPERPQPEISQENFTGTIANDSIPSREFILKYGWNNVQEDLMSMINKTLADYNTDKNRIYLSGLSFGGYGTWYTASKNPNVFAAINPVVGYAYPELMKPIADAKIPIWNISGGKDTSVPAQYFYTGINKLKELGYHNIRLTVHEDTGHVETWRRVYGGQDIYDWLLNQSK